MFCSHLGKHTKNRAGECDRCDVGYRGAVRVLVRVQYRENGVDGTNDTLQVSITEQSCATCHCRPQSLPETLLGSIDRWSHLDIGILHIAQGLLLAVVLLALHNRARDARLQTEQRLNVRSFVDECK